MQVECEICGEIGTHWVRCDEHYRCDDCGTRDDLCLYGKAQGGLLCDSCKAKRVKKQIAEWKGDSDYQDCIVCPHCGYHHWQDLWEYEHEHTYTCVNCEHDFFLSIYASPQFTTTKAAA